MPATKRTLDFTNVRDAGDVDVARVDEGWHPAKLTKVDDHESKEGNEGWRFVAETTRGRFRGHTYAIYCGLSDDQLWKVRNLATAVGLTVPKKKINVDPDKLLDREFALFLADDEYEGREQSKPTKPLFANVDDIDDDQWADPAVAKYFQTEEPEAEEEPEPEEKPAQPAKAAKTKAKARAPEPPPEDEEEVEEIDLDEL